MPRSLYIVGNGFDRAHGLKTSYWDFRTFLEENHFDFLWRFEKLYNLRYLDVDDSRIPNHIKQNWENTLKDELWGNLEEKLGYPDTIEMLQFYVQQFSTFRQRTIW